MSRDRPSPTLRISLRSRHQENSDALRCTLRGDMARNISTRRRLLLGPERRHPEMDQVSCRQDGQQDAQYGACRDLFLDAGSNTLAVQVRLLMRSRFHTSRPTECEESLTAGRIFDKVPSMRCTAFLMCWIPSSPFGAEII